MAARFSDFSYEIWSLPPDHFKQYRYYYYYSCTIDPFLIYIRNALLRLYLLLYFFVRFKGLSLSVKNTYSKSHLESNTMSSLNNWTKNVLINKVFFFYNNNNIIRKSPCDFIVRGNSINRINDN